jgi:hypothetical protein
MQTNKNKTTNYKRCLQEFSEHKINLRKDFYKNKEKFQKTSLFKYFYKMPKGVMNHVHFPAFTSVDEWLSILKSDVAFKNVETGVYGIAPKAQKLEKGCRR